MPLKFAFRVALIAALNLIPVALPLADATGAVKGSIPTASATTDTPDIVTQAAPTVGVPALELTSHADAEAELKRLQGAQDHIKQQASSATSFKQLSELDDATKQLGEDTDKLIAALLPQRAQLQAQLGVLCPPPVAGATPEAPAVAEQRTDLDTRKAQLDAELKQASDSKANLVNLTGQIARLGHGLMKNQLAFRSGSIFGAQFWSPLFQPNPDDQERLRAFGEEVSPVLKAVWQPGQKAVTVLLLVLALVVWIVGRQLAE